MRQFWILAVTCVALRGISASDAFDLTIPANLKIGTASSAYQVEGAWNVSGKGVGIWDTWTHDHPEQIADGRNGDIAANSYYKYKDDVKRIKSIGLDFYRLSISWSRVLPTGFANVINEEGLQYYKNLIKELIANGIEPMVTLHHLDHPQILEEFGGWSNVLIVDWFVDYARIIFETLGDHVKVWTTISQPNFVCAYTYDTGPVTSAPGKKLNGTSIYQCMHNVLKAHASVYHLYDKEFRPTQKGSIGITGMAVDFQPSDPKDTTSAEIALQFQFGWMFHPILKGDYPEIMKSKIANISAIQGYKRSRLPKFSEKWISYIKGTTDYVGINQYSSLLVTPVVNQDYSVYTGFDNGLAYSSDASWPKTGIPLYSVTPSGMRNFLVKVRDEYDNPLVRVTENGYSDTTGTIYDYDRISFFYEYLKAVLHAIKLDGCNVQSFTIWSLLDSFELNSGFSIKFGIVQVDYNGTETTRTNKLSSVWWKKVLKTRKLQPVPTNSIETSARTNCTGSLSSKNSTDDNYYVMTRCQLNSLIHG